MNQDSISPLSRLWRFAETSGGVFPVVGKRPAVERWQFSSGGSVAGLLALNYNAGYRIPADVLVVDVDPRNGGIDSFSRLPDSVKSLPVTVRTQSGGFHIYTRISVDPAELLTASPDYPGIDFLKAGRYVVLPGSSLDGRQWVLDPGAAVPPPDAPFALLALLQRPVAPAPKALDSGAEFLTNLELDTLLTMLPVEQYRGNEPWLRLALACHHATDGAGLPAFLLWSISDPQYRDQSEIIRARWDSMGKNPDSIQITIRTLVREIGRFGLVPDWLRIRAGLTVAPEDIFKPTETRSLYEQYQQKIVDSDDYAVLTSSIAASIAADSRLTESLRDLLYQQIAKKTGVTRTALRRDLVAFATSAAAPAEDSDADTRNQPHIAAAKDAALSLSYEGVTPLHVFQAWHRWNGSYWQKDVESAEIQRAALNSLKKAGVQVTGTSVRSVCDILRAMLSVEGNDFIQDPEKIVVYTPYHVLRFKGGEWFVEGHHPANRNLTTIKAPFVEEAGPPEAWLRFLDQTLTSERAKRAIACSIIYAAAPCAPWLRKCIYLYGPKRSGKSTLLSTIQEILGLQNCSALEMRRLGARFGPSALIGKLANITNEAVSQDTLQDDVFKALVSGESIDVDIKYKTAVTHTNTTKLFFAANSFPRILDESDATWDRMTIISCPRSVPDFLADTSLKFTLYREASQILWWAMQLFQEEYNRDRCVGVMGLDEEAERVLAKWQETNNPVLRWQTTRLVEAIGDEVSLEAAYEDYCQWCRANGHKEASTVRFGRSLKARRRRGTRGATFIVDFILIDSTIFVDDGGALG